MSLEDFFQKEEVKQEFKSLIGVDPTSYFAQVINIVNNDAKLKKCEPESIFYAIKVAASINLSIDPNSKHAYLEPYQVKGTDKKVKHLVQLQITHRGLIQLSLRSDKITRMNVTDVRESEILHYDRLSGEIDFNWINDNDERKKKKQIGFVSYLRLKSGFEKLFFMSIKELKEHGQKYSKTFKTGFWSTNFDDMCAKTTLKLLLEKYAPKTKELQIAISTDQGVFNNDGSFEYMDNGKLTMEDLHESQLNEILEKWKEVDLSNDEKLNIERIINNREKDSYSKVLVLIQNKQKTNGTK